MAVPWKFILALCVLSCERAEAMNTIAFARMISRLHATARVVDKPTSKERLKETTPNDFLQNTFEENGPPHSIPRAREKIPGVPKQEMLPMQDTHYDFLPFSLIVNQLLLKQALAIAATDPTLGIVLYGPKGTGKSVLARSLHKLLPLQGNSNAPPPMVQVPLHCQEDALLGTVDLENSLETGESVFEPGLLSACHKGLLLVDDLQLLDEELRNILLNAVQDGHVRIEREGLSAEYPCQPLLIATMNPEEGEVRSLDRISMALPVQKGMPIEERVQVVQRIEAFLDHTSQHDLHEAIQHDAELRDSIQSARIRLPQVEITPDQLLYLCQEATHADCEGQRAEIYATKIAKAAAALQGRTVVQAQDLQLGVLLAIAPRARVNWEAAELSEHDEQEEQSKQEETTPASPNELQPLPPQGIPPPPPPPPENQQQKEEEDTSETEETQMEENTSEDEKAEEPPENELELPQNFMFHTDSTPLDPRLLMFKQWTRKGRGGKRSRIFNLLRGRFVKAIFPKGKGRIAVGATLRAAAPFQKYRREHASDSKRLVYIRDSDFRIQRLKRKAGSLIIFVVDASGSMALNRMGSAKGAATMLLQDAYKSRDKICLIAFHDERADVVVPPTKSIALTKARLEQMPCGGRSPLAHALVTAMRTGLNAIKVKQDVGKVVVVLITDGRPTVPLCISEGESFDATLVDPDSKDGKPSRQFCRKEALAIARQLGGVDDLNLLVIDTEDKFVATGVAAEIARLALGNYYALGSTNVADLAAITRSHVEGTRATF